MARRTPKPAAQTSAASSPGSQPGEANRPSSPAPAALPWKPLARGAASIAIIVHLTAVFVAPLNERPSSSILTQTLVGGLRPYLDAAYLNHGYGFFSPDPGSSIIIRYALTMPDGETRSGVMPNLATDWPRLRYHRHFMLTSQAHMFGLPTEADPNGQQLPQAYARHLKQATGAKAVRLEFVEHRPSSPEEIEEGKKLSADDTYRTLAEVTLDENDAVAVRQLTDDSLPEPGEPPTFGPDQVLPAGPRAPLRRPAASDERPPFGPFPNRPIPRGDNPNGPGPEEVQ